MPERAVVWCEGRCGKGVDPQAWPQLVDEIGSYRCGQVDCPTGHPLLDPVEIDEMEIEGGYGVWRSAVSVDHKGRVFVEGEPKDAPTSGGGCTVILNEAANPDSNPRLYLDRLISLLQLARARLP